MEEHKGIIRWIKEHKKELIIAGVSIEALVLVVIGIKNKDAIKELWESLKNTAIQTSLKVSDAATEVVMKAPIESFQNGVSNIASNSEAIPFEVRRHIRNLPEGWHASPEKIEEALKNSIILMDGQTWVDGYMKGGFAA